MLNELNLIKATKRGRKKKDDSPKGGYNKYSPDIIIKAIKTKINSSFILFLNKIIIEFIILRKLIIFFIH